MVRPTSSSRSRPQHAGSSRVSACLIARDEARVLGRCLTSLSGAVDEICVVDTGSRDRTRAIAESFGARVETFTGCNGRDGRIANFAAARNASLDLATGDWVLSIDADEFLLPGSIVHLRAAVRQGRNAGVMVRMDSPNGEWLSLRLFRRRPHMRFVSRIHEFLPSIGPRVLWEPRIVIRHRPDKRGKESGADRDSRLCRAELRANPKNARALFYLGCALEKQGWTLKAIACYSKALALGTYAAGRHVTLHRLAICHMRLGAWQEAIDAGIGAIATDPRYAEVHCLIGDAYLALGRSTFARQWYKTALACGAPPPDRYFASTRSSYGPYPRRRLRFIARHFSDAAEAPSRS